MPPKFSFDRLTQRRVVVPGLIIAAILVFLTAAVAAHVGHVQVAVGLIVAGIVLAVTAWCLDARRDRR